MRFQEVLSSLLCAAGCVLAALHQATVHLKHDGRWGKDEPQMISQGNTPAESQNLLPDTSVDGVQWPSLLG